MNHTHSIQEYIDPATGRRLVSVTYSEGLEVRKSVMPFDILADDLLAFLADAACGYGDEVLPTEGYRKFENKILARANKGTSSGTP